MEIINLLAAVASIVSLVISLMAIKKVYTVENKIVSEYYNKINVSKSDGTNIAGRDIKK